MLGICIDVGFAAIVLGLIGLLFDLFGAGLIVAVDISYFDFLWQDNERAKNAASLREARTELFQEGTLLESDSGFDLARDIILEESGSDLSPIRIRAKPPGTIGGGGNVFIYEGEGADKPNEGIGAHNLVDGWIQREIEELEEGFRDQYRRLGMGLLLSGFAGQIISYVILNFGMAREFFTNLIPC